MRGLLCLIMTWGIIIFTLRASLAAGVGFNDTDNKPIVSTVDPSFSGTVSFSGNVGVGTTTPQKALTVTSGNVGIGTWVPVGRLQIKSPTAIPFLVDTAGNVGIGTILTTTARLTIMNGNIGIGTWKPEALLDVKGEIRVVVLSLPGASSIADLQSPATFTNINVGLSSNMGIGTTAQSRLSVMGGNVGIGTLTTEGGLLIVMGGNVGIGSIAPGQVLDVQGDVRATGYRASDDTAGFTGTCGGVSVTSVTIKNGLITACAGT